MTIEQNRFPPGESCNTCRFAGTHSHSNDSTLRIHVTCRRMPPQRLGRMVNHGSSIVTCCFDTDWPVLTVDDWCGEWRARISYPEAGE